MTESVVYSLRYRRYVLAVLFLGYTVNFVDRSILSLLLEPIKLDLQLGDGQLGLLGGLAFAMFYATLGIPIAALADRTSRVKVLAISMVIWSGMTAVCGLATNFIQLLIARIGVGVGEAGATPPSHSLIADYFPIESRATALSIYGLGIPVGTMIGYYVGGWGAEEFGWRTTFFIVGLPGIFVALLVWSTVREPPRGMSDIKLTPVEPVAETPPPRMKEVFHFLWKKRSFRHIGFGAALHAFVGYGVGTWNAPFLIRSHEMSFTEVGSWLALIAGIGAIGTITGGYLSDKLSDRSGDRRWYLWVPGISTLVMVPFQFMAYLYPELWAVIPSLLVIAILSGMYMGPSFAMTQALVTLRMRAVASAILLFMLNIIGMGLGPYLIGILSDLLKPLYEIDSLRYAICFSVLANIWAATHYFLGARSLRQDLEATRMLVAGDSTTAQA
jgi:MFS family permease